MVITFRPCCLSHKQQLSKWNTIIPSQTQLKPARRWRDLNQEKTKMEHWAGKILRKGSIHFQFIHFLGQTLCENKVEVEGDAAEMNNSQKQ